MSYLDVVVGGQYGSESKGRVTGDLVARHVAQGRQTTCVRVAGPNAGHVVIDPDGRRWALRQVPVGMVTSKYTIGVIAAGSEIDPTVLRDEVEQLEAAGHRVADRLLIDNQATMIEDRHRREEGGNDGPLQNRIGSTGKGIGAARADRIWRKGPIAKDAPKVVFEGLHLHNNTAAYLAHKLNHPTCAVVIEGTQGYGLGLHAGHYPYCTSSDCRAVDFLGMAGVSPWGHPAELGVWVVLRAYPIRVAGNSGPLKAETTWEALGVPEERTTVTQKVRRVGGWDPNLARAAVEANGGGRGDRHNVVRIALAMADQRFPALKGVEHWDQIPMWDNGQARTKLIDWLDEVEEQTGAPVECVGTGPRTTLWLPGDVRTRVRRRLGHGPHEFDPPSPRQTGDEIEFDPTLLSERGSGASA